MPSTLAASTVDVGGAVSDMLRSVLLFVPKLLLFLAILVIGWLVARLLLRVVDKLLDRIGFDRWVERGGIKAALARSRYDASNIVAKLVYYIVLLFTLQLAFGVWGPNPVSDLIKGIVAWLPNLLIAIVIVVVATAIAAGVRNLVGSALGGLSYGRLLANLAFVFIVGVGVVAALNQIGVATTVTTPILIAVLATIAGILVVGVGGGLVRPMQARWERWLGRAEEESATIAEHARAYAAGQRHAEAEAAATAPVQPEPVPEPEPVTYAPGVARTGAYSPEQVRQQIPQSPGSAVRPPQPPQTTVPDQPRVGDDRPTMIVPPVPPEQDNR
jgi:Mechanosensitive ion channel, conserved TM helix